MRFLISGCILKGYGSYIAVMKFTIQIIISKRTLYHYDRRKKKFSYTLDKIDPSKRIILKNKSITLETAIKLPSKLPPPRDHNIAIAMTSHHPLKARAGAASLTRLQRSRTPSDATVRLNKRPQ